LRRSPQLSSPAGMAPLQETPGPSGTASASTPGLLHEAGRQIAISPGANGVIDLTGTTRMPPRPATIQVQAWPDKSREATVLELAMAEGTVGDFEAKLAEAGYEGYRLLQLHGHKLDPPPATYRTVRALQPSRRSAGGRSASQATQPTQPATTARPSSERRERTKLLVSRPPSFDMLSKVIAPEFTAAQGIKEILDNAIQSLVFFSMDHPAPLLPAASHSPAASAAPCRLSLPSCPLSSLPPLSPLRPLLLPAASPLCRRSLPCGGSPHRSTRCRSFSPAAAGRPSSSY